MFIDNFPDDELKLLIVSTPKTGNTWLRYLLHHIYDLPMPDFDTSFKIEDMDKAGKRWVAIQHYYPQEDLIEWGRKNKVIFLTTIRHPSDTLMSLYHYIRNYSKTLPFYPAQVGLVAKFSFDAANDQSETSVVSYLYNQFFCDLSISLSWMVNNDSLVVRYEDLWLDAYQTMANLCQRIKPVSQEVIERAVELCEINLMRRAPGMSADFFRKGGIGNWREEISPVVEDIFARLTPYPQQFKALGYDLDHHSLLYSQRPAPSRNLNPFRQHDTFDNGVPIAPIIVETFLKLPQAVTRRWPEAVQTGPADSFYNWLNAPSDENQALKVSNLAQYVYRVREDVQQVYQTLEGATRIAFVEWCLFSLAREYKLAEEFIQPMKTWYVEWAGSCYDTTMSLPLTNHLSHLYHKKIELRAYFSSLNEVERAKLYRWFLAQNQEEVIINSHLVKAHQDIYTAWAEANPATAEAVQKWSPEAVQEWLNSPVADEFPLKISNLAQYVYQARKDLQQTFPAHKNNSRIELVRWLLTLVTYQQDFLAEQYILPLRAWYVEWGGSGSSQGPLPLTNYLNYQFKSRLDLQDYLGSLDSEFSRADFYNWFLGQTVPEDLTVDQDLIKIHEHIYINWANQVSPPDQNNSIQPKITNLAVYYYNKIEELQKLFPDIYGQNRVAFVSYLVTTVRFQEGLNPQTLQALVNLWTPATPYIKTS